MKKYKSLKEFFEDQPADKLKQIMLVRELIFSAEPSLQETLKWNAPNYIHDGEDRITFNIMNKQEIVRVIIHMGTSKKEDKSGKPILDDTSGMIVWNSDIRGTISFESFDDIQTKSDLFKNIIADWVALKSYFRE
jgi:hypothetical protein